MAPILQRPRRAIALSCIVRPRNLRVLRASAVNPRWLERKSPRPKKTGTRADVTLPRYHPDWRATRARSHGVRVHTPAGVTAGEPGQAYWGRERVLRKT